MKNEKNEKNVGEQVIYSRPNWEIKSFLSFHSSCQKLLKFWWIGPLSEVWQLSLARAKIGVVGETWDALRLPVTVRFSVTIGSGNWPD